MLKVFYSWQSDLQGKFNRYFIEDCMQRAIKELDREGIINIDFILDRDTKKVKGTPEIVKVIFDKIKNSNLFVADISIINSGHLNRKTPNPNVLIELGYAAGILGWENIICVFNSSMGKIEDLPFDIRTRRILSYNLGEEADKKDVKARLVKVFKNIFEDLDYKEITYRKRVLEYFKDENPKIISIALEKPEDWEFKLAEELFRDRIVRVKDQIASLDRGISFSQTKKYEAIEFMNLFEETMEDFKNALLYFETNFSQGLLKGIGDAGYEGDAIELKKILDDFYHLFSELIEREKRLKAIKPHDKLLELKELMMGWSKGLLENFLHIPDEFSKIYRNEFEEGETVTISVRIKPFIESDRIHSFLEFYRNNLGIFNE